MKKKGEDEMKKLIMLAMVIELLISGCSSVDWHTKLQRGYFDKDGKTAGLSNDLSCGKQAKKELGLGISVDDNCFKDKRCRDLVEICLKERGFIEAKTFESTEERMAIYKKAYEEGWIKPGMTRLEVVNLIGAPQVVTYQLIPPRKLWWYCRSATKTVLIGYNYVLQIIWNEDKVESVDKRFKI